MSPDTKEALRAARSALSDLREEAIRETHAPACPACDPGNEGAEVWADYLDKIEFALKAIRTAVRGCSP